MTNVCYCARILSTRKQQQQLSWVILAQGLPRGHCQAVSWGTSYVKARLGQRIQS